MEEPGLLAEVTAGLAARKGDWVKIAEDLAPDVSYSMIARLGRGKYESSPTFRRLEIIVGWLRANPLSGAPPKKRAAPAAAEGNGGRIGAGSGRALAGSVIDEKEKVA